MRYGRGRRRCIVAMVTNGGRSEKTLDVLAVARVVLALCAMGVMRMSQRRRLGHQCDVRVVNLKTHSHSFKSFTSYLDSKTANCNIFITLSLHLYIKATIWHHFWVNCSHIGGRPELSTRIINMFASVHWGSRAAVRY